MKPIFLIGYMCSGKTTLGRALAAATGVRFIDLDDMVEEMARSSPQRARARSELLNARRSRRLPPPPAERS